MEPQDKENRSWENIKPEPIEIRSHQQRKSVYSSDSLPIWAQVMGGVLAAAIIIFIFREVYDRYQLYQLQKFLEQQTQSFIQQSNSAVKQANINAERMRQKMEIQRQQSKTQRLEEEKARLAEQKKQALATAKRNKLTSDDCRFWTENYKSYQTEKHKQKMNEYCTLNRIERAVISAKF
ncbi:hypothetical protein [Marinobacterium sedimentorum]|uniref:hypothetical protein n=1 Tax=Marinobacterium sedimentorum TaxID=2927804 RepID=UPI0020C64F59|nr:hypothetical protein [Marinobacterium sedimentorum]MCP8686078.1 hypothetical protein [Marinobacterium sedimentorum]